MPNTVVQGYQAVHFLRDNLPTSPLQQHYHIKGFCPDWPNATLNPGDITFCDYEYDFDLEYLLSCNVDLFDQSDLVVGDDQRDSMTESPSSNMTKEHMLNGKSRLKESISFWEGIGASSWVLSILRDPYALPYSSEPEPKIFQNNISALRNKEFVTGISRK